MKERKRTTEQTESELLWKTEYEKTLMKHNDIVKKLREAEKEIEQKRQTVMEQIVVMDGLRIANEEIEARLKVSIVCISCYSFHLHLFFYTFSLTLFITSRFTVYYCAFITLFPCVSFVVLIHLLHPDANCLYSLF